MIKMPIIGRPIYDEAVARIKEYEHRLAEIKSIKLLMSIQASCRAANEHIIGFGDSEGIKPWIFEVSGNIKQRMFDRWKETGAFTKPPRPYKPRKQRAERDPRDQREQNRHYYQAHKEEISAKSRHYHQAHKEEISARNHHYRQAHKEELSAKSRHYYQAHKEELNAKSRHYHQAHKEELNAKSRHYHQAHKEEINARKRERRTRKKALTAKTNALTGELKSPTRAHNKPTNE